MDPLAPGVDKTLTLEPAWTTADSSLARANTEESIYRLGNISECDGSLKFRVSGLCINTTDSA